MLVTLEEAKMLTYKSLKKIKDWVTYYNMIKFIFDVKHIGGTNYNKILRNIYPHWIKDIYDKKKYILLEKIYCPEKYGQFKLEYNNSWLKIKYTNDLIIYPEKNYFSLYTKNNIYTIDFYELDDLIKLDLPFKNNIERCLFVASDLKIEKNMV